MVNRTSGFSPPKEVDVWTYCPPKWWWIKWRGGFWSIKHEYSEWAVKHFIHHEYNWLDQLKVDPPFDIVVMEDVFHDPELLSARAYCCAFRHPADAVQFKLIYLTP
jgi:hypothetical protein